jgi:hypothetical protein
MLIIEGATPKKEVCDCCGGMTTRLVRFVYQDDEPFAVYFAEFVAEHPEREVQAVVGLGDWGDDSKPEHRRAFALVLREHEAQYEVMIVNAAESPWQDVEIFGRMLDREEALAHPWIEDVFHITDHMVTDDPEIKAFFEGEGLIG